MKKTSANQMFRLAWVLLAILALTATACSQKSLFGGNAKHQAFLPQVAAVQSGATFTDPFAYCAAVGAVDKPDASYTGDPVPDAVIAGYKKAANLQNSPEPSDVFKKATIWRCMNSQVYACNFGANLPCDSKANTNKTPTQAMADFCAQNKNSDFIPMAVTGHDTIYSWKCSGTKPQVDKQINQVDAAGYITEIWYKIEKSQ